MSLASIVVVHVEGSSWIRYHVSAQTSTIDLWRGRLTPVQAASVRVHGVVSAVDGMKLHYIKVRTAVREDWTGPTQVGNTGGLKQTNVPVLGTCTHNVHVHSTSHTYMYTT